MLRAAAAAFLATAAAPAVPAHAGTAADHGVQPWTETIASVTEFEPATRLFREAGDWQLRLRGQVKPSELAYWNLPDSASADFELWCAPQAVGGCISFVRFDGVPQQPVRIAARAWDTGGIYSTMVRSDDVTALFDKAIALGWWAESPPIRFSFGISDLRNVVLQGPHGLNIAVYERISPAFAAFRVGRLSQGFNSMRMVRDRQAARDFYAEKLGFEILFDGNEEPPEPARSNFGIPLNYTSQIKRAAAALQPVLPRETGRIEVMQIEGFSGADLSHRASPPNLGWLSVRYPVTDLSGYRAALKERGVPFAYDGEEVEIAGIGRVEIFAVRDTDGSLTEFYHAP